MTQVISPEDVKREVKTRQNSNWDGVLFIEVEVGLNYEESVTELGKLLSKTFFEMSGREIPILMVEGFRVAVHKR